MIHLLAAVVLALGSTNNTDKYDATIRGEIKGIEKESGGRLGVAAVGDNKQTAFAYRGNERFLMCSTFKLLVAGATLSKVDRHQERLSRRVHYTKADLLAHAPETEKNVARGWMTVEDLCKAAVEESDNTAANLLVHSLGGPKAVTRFARSLGDAKTHLDRIEPALNDPSPNDLDTTTPISIARDAELLVLNKKLKPNTRAKLTQWLIDCQTGQTCLRAGFPPQWRAGDKTGMGGRDNQYHDSDTRNDIAVVWPGKGSPFTVAVYLTGCTLPAKKRDAILAKVARVLTSNSPKERTAPSSKGG